MRPEYGFATRPTVLASLVVDLTVDGVTVSVGGVGLAAQILPLRSRSWWSKPAAAQDAPDRSLVSIGE
jgi:hypothetical protein